MCNHETPLPVGEKRVECSKGSETPPPAVTSQQYVTSRNYSKYKVSAVQCGARHYFQNIMTFNKVQVCKVFRMMP